MLPYPTPPPTPSQVSEAWGVSPQQINLRTLITSPENTDSSARAYYPYNNKFSLIVYKVIYGREKGESEAESLRVYQPGHEPSSSPQIWKFCEINTFRKTPQVQKLPS